MSSCPGLTPTVGPIQGRLDGFHKLLGRGRLHQKMTFCERGFQLGNGFRLARIDNERNVEIDEMPRDGSADAVRETRVDDCRRRRVFLQPGSGVRDGEWSRLENMVPLAGMPVEAFIQTGERTALAYLTKPLADQVVRAFREESGIGGAGKSMASLGATTPPLSAIARKDQ
ncbi:hypothetical protein [Rhizobium leguminosarum]|uniref:hypothetical protein n=1 Tax=Rhizobium leguminosarum TaxID=384 RepID=UPI003F99C092